jgi:hypothetical protein
MFRPYLVVELAVLFVGVPMAIRMRVVPRIPVLVLLVAGAVCAETLLRDPSFDRVRLWNVAGAMAHAGGVVVGLLKKNGAPERPACREGSTLRISRPTSRRPGGPARTDTAFRPSGPSTAPC